MDSDTANRDDAPVQPNPAETETAKQKKGAKTPKQVNETSESTPPQADKRQPLPCVDGVWGRSLRKLPGGRLGVEPFLTQDEAAAAAKRLGIEKKTVPFQYQYAWVLLDKDVTRYIALGRGRQPFRTQTDARHTIRMNPAFGERQYDVLPYGDGFAIVPRALEITLRCCYPSFVAFILAEGGERDVATVQANDSGHRMVFSRGKKVSAPFGVFSALRDAQGAVVDPVSNARPGQAGFKVRGTASKFPMQNVLGAIDQNDHMAAADAGRELRRLQIEREAENRLTQRPDAGFSRLDGSEDPDVTVGL